MTCKGDSARRSTWADAVRTARDKLGYSRAKAARVAAVPFPEIMAVEGGFASPADVRERLGRTLTGDPRALLTRAEADEAARAAGLSRERWIGSAKSDRLTEPPPLRRQGNRGQHPTHPSESR